MNRTRRSIWMLAGLFFLAAWASLPAEEEKESDFSASASVNLLTNYMWRGLRLSEGFVTQQSATLGYRGFAFNAWSNVDFQQKRLNEVDLTLSYTRQLGPVELEAGWVYYGVIDGTRSNELYAAGTLSTLLSPKLALYVDLDAGKGAFLQASVEHSFPIPGDVEFTLGGNIGFIFDNAYTGVNDLGEEFCAPFNAEVQASITFPLGRGFELVPSVAYSVPLSENARQAIRAGSFDGHTHTVYGGVTLNYTH